MAKLYLSHEFEAVKLKYQTCSELLYRMTLLDLQVFTGYVTIQGVFGAWLIANIKTTLVLQLRLGLLIIDLVFAAIAFVLIQYNFQRRNEVASEIKQCSKALGYRESGAYIPKEAISGEYPTRPWAPWYQLGVVVAFVGMMFLIFGPNQQDGKITSVSNVDGRSNRIEKRIDELAKKIGDTEKIAVNIKNSNGTNICNCGGETFDK